ncbi:hypothetical protein DXG01_012535, partial [Tephrocybe rancida]
MSNATEVTRQEGMTVVETADGEYLFPKFLIPWVDQRASHITAEAAALRKRKLTVA